MASEVSWDRHLNCQIRHHLQAEAAGSCFAGHPAGVGRARCGEPHTSGVRARGVWRSWEGEGGTQEEGLQGLSSAGEAGCIVPTSQKGTLRPPTQGGLVGARVTWPGLPVTHLQKPRTPFTGQAALPAPPPPGGVLVHSSEVAEVTFSLSPQRCPEHLMCAWHRAPHQREHRQGFGAGGPGTNP